MNNFSHVPPGFRFHPTDEELVDYYLRKKVASKRIDLDVIKDVDLYKIEPWDLQELCRIGSEEQNEWYFFSHKDKKYPTGTRTNRATRAGFWKATGRDKAIYSKNNLIGMRKTLVFYQGRAPNGQKSDWIMHEYRLETNENGTPQEEGWVVCRVFKKRMPTIRREGEHEALCWYDDQAPFMADFDSPRRMSQPYNTSYPPHNYSCKQELDHQPHHYHHMPPHDPSFLQLPQLESPKLPRCASASMAVPYNTYHDDHHHQHLQQSNQLHVINNSLYSNNNTTAEQVVDQVTTDWRVLDKFVASQLSHDHQNASKEAQGDEDLSMLMDDSKRQEMMTSELSSVATSSNSQIDMWK